MASVRDKFTAYKEARTDLNSDHRHLERRLQSEPRILKYVKASHDTNGGGAANHAGMGGGAALAGALDKDRMNTGVRTILDRLVFRTPNTNGTQDGVDPTTLITVVKTIRKIWTMVNTIRENLDKFITRIIKGTAKALVRHVVWPIFRMFLKRIVWGGIKFFFRRNPYISAALVVGSVGYAAYKGLKGISEAQGKWNEFVLPEEQPGGPSTEGLGTKLQSLNQGASANTGTAVPQNLMGSRNADRALSYFMSNGWTYEQATGIVIGLMGESGKELNPAIVNPTSGAYGIAQWLGDRVPKFEQIMGTPLKGSSFEQQLAFVQWELNNTYRSVGQSIQNSSSVSEITTVFVDRYEVSQKTHEKRVIDATQRLQRFSGYVLSKADAQNLVAQGVTTANSKVVIATGQGQAVPAALDSTNSSSTQVVQDQVVQRTPSNGPSAMPQTQGGTDQWAVLHGGIVNVARN